MRVANRQNMPSTSLGLATSQELQGIFRSKCWNEFWICISFTLSSFRNLFFIVVHDEQLTVASLSQNETESNRTDDFSERKLQFWTFQSKNYLILFLKIIYSDDVTFDPMDKETMNTSPPSDERTSCNSASPFSVFNTFDEGNLTFK